MPVCDRGNPLADTKETMLLIKMLKEMFVIFELGILIF